MSEEVGSILPLLPESHGTLGSYRTPPSLTFLPCDVVTMITPRPQDHGEEYACMHSSKYPSTVYLFILCLFPKGFL